MNRIKSLMFALIVMSVLSGCSTIQSFTMPEDQNLLSGAGSIMKGVTNQGDKVSTEGFEEIDLQVLLAKYGLDNPVTVGAEQAVKVDEYKYLRNDLQERLITASNQRCSTYIRTIISSKSQAQMGWTGLATLLSGAAAVVPHAQTAKALAAGSTVSTGLLTTYNEAYFNNLAVTVVSSGISKQRESILASISKLKSKPLSEYPVNAAIADALAYHAACNIVSGMEAAAKATSATEKDKFSPLAR